MITSDQLAAVLLAMNVKQVAQEAGVATKTVYRLRHKQHSPRLETVQRILDAVERISLHRRR